MAIIFYSFTQYSGVLGTPLNVCGLCNYHSAFTNLLPDVGDSLKVTVIYVIGVTLGQNVIALLLRCCSRNAVGRSPSTAR